MTESLPIRPVLRRHLAPHVFGDEGVVLLSEQDRYLLSGSAYEALIPLLTGEMTTDEIVDRLSGQTAAQEVYYALMRLLAAGHIRESGDPEEGDGTVFWDSLGVDPDSASEALAHRPVSVRHLGAPSSVNVSETLASLGLSIADEGVLDVLTVDDYLDPRLAEHNRQALAAGRPWLLCRPEAREIWIGPLFVPGETSCWSCLAHRLAQRRPMEAYVASRRSNERPPHGPPAGSVASYYAALGFLASNLIQGLGTGDWTHLREVITTVDATGASTGRHSVVRRPQCPACGDPQLFRRTAEAPIRLESRARQSDGRGGYRSSTPEDTYRRFRRHIDPLTGIVPGLRRHTKGSSGLVHSYSAGPNTALRLRRLSEVRAAIRSTNAGKGRSRVEAKVSALGEAIERYSGVFQGDEPRVRARMGDLEGAVHPNDCMRFSEAQYRDREQLNRRTWLVDYVPRRFDTGEAVDWSPVWSLTHDRRAYLPTMLLYADYPCRLEERFCFAESNGAAAGNCLEEAALHGLLELVERDCVSLWWYNRVPRPQVSPSELTGAYYQRLRRAYRSMGREWWVLDLTTDLGISCFAAVTRKTQSREEILLGLGAHLDPGIAIRRAVTEMNQVLVLSGSRNSPFRREKHAADWLEEASLEGHPYLAPSGESDLSLDPPLAHGEADLRGDVERCCSLLGQEGLEVLVANQTRPDVGVAVARVVVPGLRNFRARFGSGRLYEVPVKLGWRDRPIPEQDLNPTSFFL